MAEYVDLVERVAADVPGAMDNLILREIARGVADFFRRTEAWRVDITGATYTTDNMVFTSGVPEDTRVMGIIELRHDDVPLRPKTMAAMQADYINTSTGTPKVYSLPEDDVCTVTPYGASTDTGFRGRAIVYPTLSNTEFPDLLYDRYEETICMGVISRLLLQPQKTWTNRQLGGDYLQLYEGQLDEHRLGIQRRNRSAKVTRRHSSYGGLL